MAQPLLPFSPHCVLGLLKRRIKRFIVEFYPFGESLSPQGYFQDAPFAAPDKTLFAHTNNSGSMLGLTRPGSLLLLSRALNPERKLPYTLELIRLPSFHSAVPSRHDPLFEPGQGLWAGVNTLTPNRLLRAAFTAGKLPWARGYTQFRAEAARGQSRLDALLTGPGLPPLWVECKNVTLVEDGVAAFPDAVTLRGQKHLREMTAIAKAGERAVFFFCVQRTDARCFGPADYIDASYAELFYKSLEAGVEMHPHTAVFTQKGIDLGPALPLAPLPGNT